MKNFIYTLLFGALVLTSCTEAEGDENHSDQTSEDNTTQVDQDELTTEEKLSTRWVLVHRRNMKGDKTRDFEKEPTSIVTYFEDNGYFRVYDSITKAKNEEGVQKIEQRNSGQWEINENGILVLRYTKPDTVITEHFSIEELDRNKLVIKSKEKDMISEYERKY